MPGNQQFYRWTSIIVGRIAGRNAIVSARSGFGLNPGFGFGKPGFEVLAYGSFRVDAAIGNA